MTDEPVIRPVDTDALGVERVTGEINFSVAHPARVFDYLLGGRDNWPADREVGERVRKVLPTMEDEVRANRRFLRRAVRHAVSQGVTQFIDIGTGLPTARPAHEIAQAEDPDARVIYVDNDPIVITHARSLLVHDDRTQVIQADAREPEAILEHPQVQARIDFDKPVALVFLLLLHFLTDAELDGLMDRYVRGLPSGSRLVISHVLDSPQLGPVTAAYETMPAVIPRGRTDIAELFAGWDLIEPGLTLVHNWRPDPDGGPRSNHVIGAVAVKR